MIIQSLVFDLHSYFEFAKLVLIIKNIAFEIYLIA